MKLFKSVSNTIRNLLSMLDTIVDGTNELALTYRDICRQTRQEQALESLADVKALAKAAGVTDAELRKVQAAIAAG